MRHARAAPARPPRAPCRAPERVDTTHAQKRIRTRSCSHTYWLRSLGSVPPALAALAVSLIKAEPEARRAPARRSCACTLKLWRARQLALLGPVAVLPAGSRRAAYVLAAKRIAAMLAPPEPLRRDGSAEAAVAAVAAAPAAAAAPVEVVPAEELAPAAAAPARDAHSGDAHSGGAAAGSLERVGDHEPPAPAGGGAPAAAAGDSTRGSDIELSGGSTDSDGVGGRHAATADTATPTGSPARARARAAPPRRDNAALLMHCTELEATLVRLRALLNASVPNPGEEDHEIMRALHQARLMGQHLAA